MKPKKSPKKPNDLLQSPLGKTIVHVTHYSPQLLFPIPRKTNRARLGIKGRLPFYGFDLWNGFELSWLNSKGKPVVAVADFRFPANSANLVESKSFKLYLNSYNNTQFKSMSQVQKTIQKDLTKAAKAKVEVKLHTVNAIHAKIGVLEGRCLDDLDIECSEYLPNPKLLKAEGTVFQEILYTNLLRSNCPVTGHPDWGSVEIRYKGSRISHEGLLKYIVSLRNHDEFHEQCVERIFTDILRECKPKELSVYARYTRRGGLDINPFRTTKKQMGPVQTDRLLRQ